MASSGFGGSCSFSSSDHSFDDGKGALVNTMREEAENLRVELQNAQENCHKLQRHIEKESEERARIKKHASTLFKERIEKEKLAHQNELSDLKAQLFEQKKHAESLHKMDSERVKSVEIELNKRFNEVRELENRYSSLKDEVRQKETELQESLERQKQDYESEISDLRNQIADLTTTNEEIQGQRDSAEQRIRDLENDLEDRDKELRELQDTVTSLKEQNESHHSKEQELEQTFERQKDAFENEIWDLKSELLEKSELKDESDIMYKSAFERTQKLETEMDARGKEIRQLQETVALLKEDNEKKSKNYLPCEEVRRRELRAALDVRKIKTELDAAVAEKKALQQAWLELDHQFEEVSLAKERYQEKVNLLEKEISKSKKKISFDQSDSAKMKIRFDDNDLFLGGGFGCQSILVTDALGKELMLLKEKVIILQAQQKAMETGCRKQFQDLSSKIDLEYEANKRFEWMENELSKLKDQIGRMQEQQYVDDNYRKKMRDLVEMSEEERNVSHHYVDKLADLVQHKEDTAIRLRMTEEHLGEYRRDNQLLEDQLRVAESNLKQLQEANNKLRSGLSEAMDKINAYKNEKDYFEKLYQSFKDKIDSEMIQKDAKIAQQDKLITHLQIEMYGRKNLFCITKEKKQIDRMKMGNLGKAIDLERSKNIDLASRFRRLQQEVVEKRLMRRRSRSEDRIPVLDAA